ncbi:MAG: RDD family protein [Dongiaceae bacterium]
MSILSERSPAPIFLRTKEEETLAQLPALRLNDAPWHDTPPEPLTAPALFASIRTRRVFGHFVDLVIVGVMLAVMWVVMLALGIVTLGLAWALIGPAMAAIPILYYTLTIGGLRSATLGMRTLDVEVRSWNGDRPGYLQAFLMTVIFLVTVWSTALLILLVSLFDRRGRTLHDILSATIVVRASALAQTAGQFSAAATN